MIIGVAGCYASGKGEAVAFLESRGFSALSLSDVLREELAARGVAETRESMIETGNALRAAEGPAVLARRLLRRCAPDRNYTVDSVRHPAEVDALREAAAGFRLLWIEAGENLRLTRLQQRGRPGDPQEIEALRRTEGLELEGGGDPAGQQLLAVRKLADFELRNEGALEALHSELQRWLRGQLYFERPGWDDYFMSIAQMVSTRSNCVKRRVAAVIAVDRRIVATGYNGTPRGLVNCNEGGCPRCNDFGESGKDLGECLCSHAEENAITQSAYHGVSIRGGAIYCTCCPCLICTKMIVNVGIAEVIYSAGYPLGDVSLRLLRQAGVKVRQLPAG